MHGLIAGRTQIQNDAGAQKPFDKALHSKL